MFGVLNCVYFQSVFGVKQTIDMTRIHCPSSSFGLLLSGNGGIPGFCLDFMMYSECVYPSANRFPTTFENENPKFLLRFLFSCDF